MAFVAVLCWLAGALLTYLALPILFQSRALAVTACLCWAVGFLWQHIGEPVAALRWRGRILPDDRLWAGRDNVLDFRKLARYLPSGQSVSVGMQRTASIIIDLKPLMLPIYAGNRVTRREALSACAQNFRSVELLQSSTEDSFFKKMKGRVLDTARQYAQVLSSSMEAAADGVVCLRRGVNIFNVLKETRGRPHSIQDIVASLEQLTRVAQSQSEKAAAVMEGFDGILTRLAEEQTKGNKYIERKLEAAKKAKEKAKDSHELFLTAGGAAVVVGLTVATGGAFGLGTILASSVGAFGHVVVGGAAVAGGVGFVGSGVAALEFRGEGSEERAQATREARAAQDLDNMVENIGEIGEHVKPFHTFWTILHDTLKQIILDLKQEHENHERVARINYFNVDLVAKSWEQAIISQCEYLEDLNMEIKQMKARY